MNGRMPHPSPVDRNLYTVSTWYGTVHHHVQSRWDFNCTLVLLTVDSKCLFFGRLISERIAGAMVSAATQ